MNPKDLKRDMEILRENIAVVQRAERSSSSRKAKELFSVNPKHLNYEGRIIEPYEDQKMRKMGSERKEDVGFQLPWSVDKGTLEPLPASDFGGTLLDEEIRRFAKWIEPTAAERVARQAVAYEVNDVIESAMSDFEDTAWNIFGSSKTGLLSPVSDIDVRIYDTRDTNADVGRKLRNMVDQFNALRGAFKDSKTFTDPTVRYGRFPLLNFTHAATGIEIQLVASNDTAPQNEVMTRFLDEFPRVHEVFYVVRAMFSMRGFLDVWSGGLGSYGLFIMLVAALKRYSAARPEMSMYASNQLLAFLHFYRDLDMEKHGVSVSRNSRFLKHDPDPKYETFAELAAKRGDSARAGQWLIGQKRPLTHWLLCLQDPADPTNDLGRRSHAIKHIQRTMTNTANWLVATKKLLTKEYGSKRDYRSRHDSVLTMIVGRCDLRWRQRRSMMERYGETIMAREREEDASRSLSAAAADAEAAAQELEKAFHAGQVNEDRSAAKN
ncbi:Hypothetical predicted protein [Lecanosticta acicola]|uniref:Poly(A) RNA polymerase mitochondrial-like central palm domain-containing protein n=1 Tax=Lecanosticta acicola TaxID=111012 RepID=A0AAI9E8L3_9PEZI|nr:Hypothetical predicted protein [Lecanosticta acicola]